MALIEHHFWITPPEFTTALCCHGNRWFSHHFKMMKRNKEISSKEISPSGENTVPGSDTNLWTLPAGCCLECVSDFYLPVSVNSILQDQGQNSSPPITLPWLTSLLWLHSQGYMWTTLLFYHDDTDYKVKATFTGCTTTVQSAFHVLSPLTLTARKNVSILVLRTMNFRCGELMSLACTRSHG